MTMKRFVTRARVRPNYPTLDGTVLSVQQMEEMVRRANTLIAVVPTLPKEDPRRQGILVLENRVTGGEAPVPAGVSLEGMPKKRSDSDKLQTRPVELNRHVRVGKALSFSLDDGALWSRYEVDMDLLSPDARQGILTGTVAGFAAFNVIPDTDEWKDISAIIIYQAEPGKYIGEDQSAFHKVVE